MTFKRSALWVACVLCLATAGIYAELLRELGNQEPAMLAACIDAEMSPMAWTCHMMLRHREFTPGEVARLNQGNGAMHAVAIKDLAIADEMLTTFIAQGVDINRRADTAEGGTTVLHLIVFDGDLARVRLLLKHGARTDIPNGSGLTALNYATKLCEKHPDAPERREILRLLRDANATSRSEGVLK